MLCNAHVLHLEEEGRGQANESARDNDEPENRGQARVHRIEAKAACLDDLVVGAQRFRVQNFLAFTGGLKIVQRVLKAVHHLDTLGRGLAPLLQRPGPWMI